MKSSKGTQDRIIKMRNVSELINKKPWGHKEWKGDWSDLSDMWTPELKQSLNVQNVDDGMFWISVNDFVHEFGQVLTLELILRYVLAKFTLIINIQQ